MNETWIDLTIRPEGDPEVNVNPLTDEIEFSWTLPGGSSRFVLLLPLPVVAKMRPKMREILAVLP